MEIAFSPPLAITEDLFDQMFDIVAEGPVNPREGVDA